MQSADTHFLAPEVQDQGTDSVRTGGILLLTSCVASFVPLLSQRNKAVLWFL